jgi:hypothetical protein
MNKRKKLKQLQNYEYVFSLRPRLEVGDLH